MALRLMLEFGARRPTNAHIFFFFLLMLLLLLLSVSDKRKPLAGHWSVSEPGYFGRSVRWSNRNMRRDNGRSVCLYFSVRMRRVVGFRRQHWCLNSDNNFRFLQLWWSRRPTGPLRRFCCCCCCNNSQSLFKSSSKSFFIFRYFTHKTNEWWVWVTGVVLHLPQSWDHKIKQTSLINKEKKKKEDGRFKCSSRFLFGCFWFTDLISEKETVQQYYQ